MSNPINAHLMGKKMSEKFITNFNNSNQYRKKVHELIAGGAHTYSKGDDQFPQLAPAAISRGSGGRVWDIDENEYVDCGLGLGAVSLGHGHESVLSAVQEQLRLGAAFSRPAVIELDFAQEFVEVIPGAERIKFAKNGSTVTTAAVKLARAYTGRDMVAFPGNQPFFSYDDWFVGLTACNSGVPDAVKKLSLHYDSTRPETLQALFDEYPNQIACVITEPQDVIPQPVEILRQVAQITRKAGAVFVLDEMVTGYRAGWPGMGASNGITSDLCTWGKSMGNGFSVCALTGRADIMDLGGIMANDAPRVFLISSTHGGEAHALAAARAVLYEYQECDVISHQLDIVKAVRKGFNDALSHHGLQDVLEVGGADWRLICLCRDREGNLSQTMRTLFIQEMIGRGALFPGYFLPCFSHTAVDVEQVVEAFDGSCGIYLQALESGGVNHLVGQATRPVFRKYNGCEQVCPQIPCSMERQCIRN